VTTPTSTSRDVVLTVIHRADFNYIAPFVISLKNSGFRGATVVFTSKIDAESVEKLRCHGVTVVPFRFSGKRDRQRLAWPWPIWRRLFSTGLSANVKRRMAHCAFHLRYRRYLLYLDFLDRRAADFDRAFIADSRDVFFQSDPFAWDWKLGVHVFLEGPANKIGICPQHRRWLTFQFGLPYVEKHSQRTPICSGTTFGDIDSLRRYLNAMVAGTMRAQNLSRMSDGDQGIHNYVLIEKLAGNVIVHENGHGPVMTMHHVKGWQADANGTVLNENRDLVPILHQYDRFPDLKARLLNGLQKA
jgi:hypothetical protein